MCMRISKFYFTLKIGRYHVVEKCISNERNVFAFERYLRGGIRLQFCIPSEMHEGANQRDVEIGEM